jgi:hypothetical protein
MSSKIKREIKIKYQWRDKDGKDIDDEDIESLQDHAIEVIARMIVEGRSEGTFNKENYSNGRCYCGKWKVK